MERRRSEGVQVAHCEQATVNQAHGLRTEDGVGAAWCSVRPQIRAMAITDPHRLEAVVLLSTIGFISGALPLCQA